MITLEKPWPAGPLIENGGGAPEVIFGNFGTDTTTIARVGAGAPGGGNYISPLGAPHINATGQVGGRRFVGGRTPVAAQHVATLPGNVAMGASIGMFRKAKAWENQG